MLRLTCQLGLILSAKVIIYLHRSKFGFEADLESELFYEALTSQVSKISKELSSKGAEALLDDSETDR